MARNIKIDGVSFDADFIGSFATEKDAMEHLAEPQYSDIWAGLSKTERTKKFKLLYKLSKNENTSVD